MALQAGQVGWQLNAAGGADLYIGGILTMTFNADGTINQGAISDTLQTIAGDGAVYIPAGGEAWCLLTKGSAAAITIPVPATPAQDGIKIHVWTSSAFAHVITQATDGFNAKGSSGTATCATPFIFFELLLFANKGHWYTVSADHWTIA